MQHKQRAYDGLCNDSGGCEDTIRASLRSCQDT